MLTTNPLILLIRCSLSLMSYALARPIQNVLNCLSQMCNNKIRPKAPHFSVRPLHLTVTRKDEYGSIPQAMPWLQITHLIANGNGLERVQSQFTDGLLKESRTRLAASATVIGVMRADVDAVQMSASHGEFIFQPTMDSLQSFKGEIPSGNA